MAEARGWQQGRRPVDRFDDRRPLRRDTSPPDKRRAVLDEPWQHPQVLTKNADLGAPATAAGSRPHCRCYCTLSADDSMPRAWCP